MVRFRAGRNIAMKIPAPEYEKTEAFYRDVLRLPQIQRHSPHAVFDFGGKNLWLDKVDGLNQAEVWLEICADDVGAAAEHFDAHGIARRDEVEELPEVFDGFWISSPSGIIHLVSSEAR